MAEKHINTQDFTDGSKSPVDRIPDPELVGLVGQLGFAETDQLMTLRHKIAEASDSGNLARVKELFAQYEYLGEEVVNKQEGDAFPKAQIGFVLAKALLWKEAGRHDLATTELYDAKTYAENMGDEAAVTTIAQAYERAKAEGYSEGVAEKVISLLKELKAAGVEVDFDEEDLEHIREMDDEEAPAYLFDCLDNAGVEDPEALLREKGLLQ